MLLKRNKTEGDDILKKMLCMLISVLFIITVFSPFAVYANVKFGNSTVASEENSDTPDTDVNFDFFNPDEKTAKEMENTIIQGLLSMQSRIDLAKYKIPNTQAAIVISNIINGNSDLFFVSTNIAYSYNTTTTYVVSFVPAYALSSVSEINSAKILFNNEMNKILAKTNDGMSDLQKALTVHDYICNMAVYPNLNNGDEVVYHSAYGFVKDRKIVCAGYALMYSAVLSKLNIPTKYVISNSMGHAWNAVYINNNWYNADLTWDDTSFSNVDTNTMGRFSHEYFLKSTYEFQTYKEHTGMVYPYNVACTDYSYDEAFWNNYTCNIFTYQNCYYYLDLDASNFLVNIIKRDENGNTAILNNKKYPSVYLSYGNGMKVPLGQITMINDVLYFSTSSNNTATINCYDLKTNKEYKITEFEGMSAGMGELDGELQYTLLNNETLYTSVKQQPIFDNIYPSNVNKSDYIPYVDINHDGYINAKDYAQIKN